MAQHSIAVIGGDGIGPEVTAEALKVLRATGVDIAFTEFDISARRGLSGGELITDEEVAGLRAHDGVLFGAVGDPRLASGTEEREVLLRLRFEFDLAVNLRPVRQLPGAAGPISGIEPESVDMLFLRENTEGPYAGTGGRLRRGTEHETALQDSVNTRFAVRRTVRRAFELAQSRRKSLTWAHKTNVLTHAGGLWQDIVDEQRAGWPDVEVDYMHADAACIHLVQNPGRFDVVVTDNLFGDILTDLAGAISGGIGYLPSASVNTEGTAPGIFEPIHGTAPDIAGRGVANPVGSILSAAMLLDELGESRAGAAVDDAVRSAAAAGSLQGRTSEIGDLVAGKL
jgi:3-isopropylmalate dehydrogenase